MSRVELESFIKSFLLFFSSLSLLISTLFYLNYLKEVKTLDEQLFSQMRVCSFDLKCTQFTIDFVAIKNQELYTLYKSEKGLKSYFPISGADKFYMQMHFEAQNYHVAVAKIQSTALLELFGTIIIVLLLSIFFSLYALSPLRKALHLTQEFIKDILHDFNTPLSSLRLNSYMLKKEISENEKVLRIEQGVENILSLQENLKAYLHNHETQKSNVDVVKLLHDNIALIQKNYEDISFIVQVDSFKLKINEDAFSRVVNNILSNAAKYNKKNGKITITYEKDQLNFIDTGKGIKNPSKIFNRFYKEQERGIGIGLHIVKKLCDELDIKIEVQSELGIGSTFSLDLRHYSQTTNTLVS